MNEKDPIQPILDQMTLQEKIALCSGKDFWHTKGMPQHQIPSIMLSDGPHGLRKQESSTDMLGINNSVPATSFPTASISACSWDEALLQKMGEALGEEASAYEVSVVLGPGANIKRNPLCGRNFEYFSEDPYLTGKMAAAHIRGIESTGTGSSLKHFALNSQEYRRFSSDSIADERTMREIYLSGFEAAVKEGKPSTVMCAYNKVNGEHCSDSRWLLREVLRDDWGFDGLVVTDWGAMSDRIKGFRAGCDLVMPGGSAYMERESAAAVRDGTLSDADIDASASRVIRLVKKTSCQERKLSGLSEEEKRALLEGHYELARQIAEESAVLLKNEDHILPLGKNEKVLFIGRMAKEMRYQGAGSSHINPWKLLNPLDACPEIRYVEGYDKNGRTDEGMLGRASRSAAEADKVIVFAGLPDAFESEGFDRTDMKMPAGEIELIERIAAVNPNVAVVLFTGSAVELPWADKVKSILYVGLPGEAGGEAIARLLYGEVNPSGKLAESWPLRYEDCVSSSYYSSGRKDAQYREGIFVGYRYYASADIPVRYAFGHGLSYTTFRYSGLKVENADGKILVSFAVTNDGPTKGKEVAQVYVGMTGNEVVRPVRELKAFAKLSLLPGETKEIQLSLDERSFAVWNDGWKVPEGSYRIEVGTGSDNLALIETVRVDANTMSMWSICKASDIKELPMWYKTLSGVPSQADLEAVIGRKITAPVLKKGQFTMDNTVFEMKDYSLIMKIMYSVMRKAVLKNFDGTPDESDPTYKMMISSSADCSLSGMKINGGMDNYMFEGMLEMANGHFFRGIKTISGKTR